MSSLNLVAAAGALVAGSVSDTLGRKRSIAAACLVFITGSIIKIAAQSFGYVLTGLTSEMFCSSRGYVFFFSLPEAQNKRFLLCSFRPVPYLYVYLVEGFALMLGR